ncbi:MAG: CvpA family protein [Muribaculaceae bacterium]|nr:CvpA family protein [Muribaculaceae bacterium]
MSALDIFILLVAVLSLVYGYCRGVIKQIGVLMGVVAGVVACRLFGDTLSDWFAGNNPNADNVYITGVFTNLILFIVGFIAALILAKALKIVSRQLALASLDRFFGAIFSLLSWFFAFSMILNVWQAFKPDTNVMDSSKLFAGAPAEFIIDFAPAVVGSETAQSMFHAIDRIGRDTPDE